MSNELLRSSSFFSSRRRRGVCNGPNGIDRTHSSTDFPCVMRFRFGAGKGGFWGTVIFRLNFLVSPFTLATDSFLVCLTLPIRIFGRNMSLPTGSFCYRIVFLTVSFFFAFDHSKHSPLKMYVWVMVRHDSCEVLVSLHKGLCERFLDRHGRI